MKDENRVVLITAASSGNHRTEFTASRVATANSDGNSVYRETFRRALGVMEKDELNAPEPIEVVRVLERAITANWPLMCYVVDSIVARSAPTLKRFLPCPLVEHGLKRVFMMTWPIPFSTVQDHSLG